MQNHLVRSKTIGVTGNGGRGTAGAGPGRDLLYSEHFPAGYFPIPYTLGSPDAEPFPQPPPLREPLEAALFGKWDRPGNPHLVWRIDATRVNFALTKGVLSRFCCAVMGRYPTTLAVELKLSQVIPEAFNKTLKLCTAAASKEFVNILDLQEKPSKGLDPEEQWLCVDPVKKSGWTHRTEGVFLPLLCVCVCVCVCVLRRYGTAHLWHRVALCTIWCWRTGFSREAPRPWHERRHYKPGSIVEPWHWTRPRRTGCKGNTSAGQGRP